MARHHGTQGMGNPAPGCSSQVEAWEIQACLSPTWSPPHSGYRPRSRRPSPEDRAKRTGPTGQSGCSGCGAPWDGHSHSRATLSLLRRSLLPTSQVRKGRPRAGGGPHRLPSPASLGPGLQMIWTYVTPSGSDSRAQARLLPGALPQCSLAFLPTATTLPGCRRTPHRAHNRQLSIPSSHEQPEETGWVLPGWGAREQRPCWASSPHPGMTLVLGPPSAGLSSQLTCWPFPRYRPTLAHVRSQGHRTGQDGAVGSPIPRDWGAGPAGHCHPRKASARLPRRERWSTFNIGRLGVNPVLPKMPE